MWGCPSGLYKATDYPEVEGLAKAKAEAEVKKLELTIEGKRRLLFNRELKPLQLKLEEAQQRLQSLG